jgi:hypothetical protein
MNGHDMGRAEAAVAMARSHGIRLRRLRLASADRRYDVDFRAPDGVARPLSIIAGAFSTGKTTILEFIDYCLGASDHPRHPEVMPKVREAILEVDLSGVTYLIERPVGEPSAAAFVRLGRLDEPPAGPVERRPLRPAGSPNSLSSLLLAHCKLDGVRLRDGGAPGPPEPDGPLDGAAEPDVRRAGPGEDKRSRGPTTDPLSFRDLMPLCFLANERLDSKNLLFESNHAKHLKLRQVVDVIFDVHDDRAVELGSRIKEFDVRLTAARGAYEIAREILAEQQPGDPAELRRVRAEAVAELAAVERALAALDQRARASTGYSEDLRERHHEAATRAGQAYGAVRDQETGLNRLISLRTQYADDVSKLTMLVEAHRIFDPLRVRTCPACLTPLAWPPAVDGGACTMCHSELSDPHRQLTLAAAMPSPSRIPPRQATGDLHPMADGGSDPSPAGPGEVTAELRAARARLADITTVIEELERALPAARKAAAELRDAEVRAAAAVDAATVHAVTPYLAERDALAARRLAAAVARQRAEDGLRRTESLERRANDVAAHESTLSTLREELAAMTGRQPERAAVIQRVSQRYRAILAAWRYPKLSDAYLADDLTPFLRGRRYTAASSGGRTLISLAWQLAVFEVAWETDSSHPGFLLLDSPQKNLGQPDGRHTEFPDAVTIADVYRHLRSWLAGPGIGAQVVVADNAPPAEAERDVIVRFSRRPDQPPYGLIDDDTG